jgi:1,4-dihydroxy-2-naphthoyl-CoA hydrolase
VSQNEQGIAAIERANRRSPGTFVGLLGIEIVDISEGIATGRLEIRPELLAPNTYLHAGTVVTLADTLAGYGCWANLPDGASGFTTAELKTNFIGTARSGTLTCIASLRHGGRSTQIWDAEVKNGDGKVIALFRCTQMILYPRS